MCFGRIAQVMFMLLLLILCGFVIYGNTATAITALVALLISAGIAIPFDQQTAELIEEHDRIKQEIKEGARLW